MAEVRIPTNAPLKLGEILPNSGVVLDFTWREHRDGEEPGTHGVVLAMLPEGAYDPYVTWKFFKRESDNRIVCFHGTYCQTLRQAIDDFDRRSRNA
jgi:hypothetical protein